MSYMTTLEEIRLSKIALKASDATKEIWQIFEPMIDLTDYSEEEIKTLRVGIAAIICHSFNDKQEGK